ncbi:MAG: chemotaxis protein CheW [Planctomycetota bacterium]|nr:chemotaxis protein CheW [Planctomycetota bacterium]
MEPVRDDKGAAPSAQTLPADAVADYLVFELEAARYALPIEVVYEVLPSVEVDPLPGGGDALLGVITLRGRLVPVVDTWRHLGADPRPVGLRDHFLLTQVDGHYLVLPCDRVHGIQTLRISRDAESDALVRGAGRIASVVRDADGLVLVPDLGGVLPEAEAA